jgi:hypothetical protein
MTNKIILLSEEPLTLHSHWLTNIVESFFDVEYYDPTRSYNKQSTIFYTQYCKPISQIGQKFLEDGFTMVYDNLWEAPVNDTSKYIIQHWNYFRYYESLWYQHLGYHTHSPAKNYQHLALMPMRLQRVHRDAAVKKLQPWLDDFVWSYVSQGHQLPNDGDMSDWNTQRFFNPEWYNDTCFSFVSETHISLIDQKVLISEKSYKPIAFYHPFVIMGPPGILKSLKNLGFETFENLFDESYDLELNWNKRLNILVNNVKQFQKQSYDQITQEKIAHNHAHFFDTELSTQYLIQEIIYPLLNYAETR